MGEIFRRKTPDELLLSISKYNRGRFMILLGAVSGSGKTYHMLLEGNRLKKKGVDVVIGTMNAFNHPNTMEQVGGLEIIPQIDWEEHGETIRDLDIDAVLKRNPEVVLVDSLAHRNHPNRKNKTRLEDVLELIEKKISVITTVNIYELEGVKDIAEKLTGMKVNNVHCVPENTLELADEVKLLDVTPESILKRIQEGVIDQGNDRENGNKMFQRDNLAVLRELALRFLAGGVNIDLDEYRERHGLIGASGATERIVVTVQYHWNGSILIRRGHQIAKRLGGDMYIVCFRMKEKALSKEEAAFKQSITKLAKKLGGFFEEILITKEDVAEEIVEYAMGHNATRLVMGQSKRGRMEEIVNGSIVNKILRKSRNMDIIIVPDKADMEGERVLPAKQSVQKKENPYRRLSPFELEEKIVEMKRGTLKVYIGAAPGVGKTYTMLREANELKKKGIDVVIGLLETHRRKETIDQIGLLEIIPRKRILYKNVELEEMDMEAIIKRNPEVVLVDELAHTNIPLSKHQKRYMDVEEILARGISVISTMNIQHLESLNDSVEQITGVRVRETVPDQILRKADEIELIDISPKALRQRMREGNIYAMNKVEQSLNNFFKTGNLIALRELALREVADDVDDRLEAWDRKGALRGPWRKQEVIFVCVNLRDDSERLIRRGFRIAYRLKADWFVVYVKDHHPLKEEEERNLVKVRSLTERLGGNFELYHAPKRRKVVEELVIQLKNKQATQVIIGQSARTRWQEISKGSIVQKLLREIRHLDVLIVADHKAENGDSNSYIVK